VIIKTLYEHALSDVIDTANPVTKEQAERLFTFFSSSALFRWNDANNNCEDRANALCMLLDEWKIPNAKGWVFSGYIFNKIGYLKNMWKYHVAALLPVKEGELVNFYIIDPATSPTLSLVADWAANITDNPHSYYILKKGDYYIFNAGKIEKDNWYARNKRNYNWTMQGLSGINGVSSKGRAQLAFTKKRLSRTGKLFKELKHNMPRWKE
jgi:Glutaminase